MQPTHTRDCGSPRSYMQSTRSIRHVYCTADYLVFHWSIIQVAVATLTSIEPFEPGWHTCVHVCLSMDAWMRVIILFHSLTTRPCVVSIGIAYRAVLSTVMEEERLHAYMHTLTPSLPPFTLHPQLHLPGLSCLSSCAHLL